MLRVVQVEDIVGDYVRYFLGSDALRAGARDGLMALERNWAGDPLARSLEIERTLRTWQRVEAAVGAAELARNWRLQMYVRRAYHDAYQLARVTCERAIEARALKCARGQSLEVDARIAAALGAIRLGGAAGACARANETVAVWRSRVLELTAALRSSPGGDVVLTQDPTLNSEWLDVPLTDIPYLNTSLRAIRALASAGERARALRALLAWEDPGPGGVYEALGDVGRPNHLVLPGDGGTSDPARLASPSIGGDTHDPSLRLSSQRVAFILFDANLTLSYRGLAPSASYQLTVGFNRPYHPGTVGPTSHVRLVANGHDVIQPEAPAPTKATTYLVRANASGQLTLTCNMPLGVGGEGIGCGIAEIWLVASAATRALG